MSWNESRQDLGFLVHHEHDLINYAETFLCFTHVDPPEPVIRDVLQAGSAEEDVQAAQAMAMVVGGIVAVYTQMRSHRQPRKNGFWVLDAPEDLYPSPHELTALRLIAAVLNHDVHFLDLVVAHQRAYGLDGLIGVAGALVGMYLDTESLWGEQ